MSSTAADKYFTQMSIEISTKTAKECQLYTQAIIPAYYHPHKNNKSLGEWSIDCLAKAED